MAFLFGTTVKAQDWADLNRFKKENELLEKPSPNEQRVVFMGNSITIGWKNKVPEYFQNKPYINRGISGQTTPQMLLRFRQDVLDLQPAVVVILAGTNDIAENTGPITLKMIAGNIFSMAELAEAHGIRVVLSSVLPVYDYPWKKGLNPAPKIIALNTMIKQYAENHNHIYLDYYSAMVDEKDGLKAEYSNDGVHPTSAGYAVMAPLLEEALQKALNQ
tara:strand:+ start:4150 stop:4803 length:654 start_codon:yes stop_codon:yes gene_type:complete